MEILNAAFISITHYICFIKETELRKTDRERTKTQYYSQKKCGTSLVGFFTLVSGVNLSFAWRHVWTWEAADICWGVWVCERGEAVVPAGGPLTWAARGRPALLLNPRGPCHSLIMTSVNSWWKWTGIGRPTDHHQYQQVPCLLITGDPLASWHN